MLDVKYWRDTANRYDDDPTSSAVSAEAKRRLMYLSLGVKDALKADLTSLTHEKLARVDPKDVWTFEKKHNETQGSANELNATLKGIKAHGKGV
jgi:hypothetical protein